MSNKRFLLLIISIVLFGLSFISLITAIAIQAFFDEGLYASVVFGIVSFVTAFAAIITIILFGKGEKQ